MRQTGKPKKQQKVPYGGLGKLNVPTEVSSSCSFLSSDESRRLDLLHDLLQVATLIIKYRSIMACHYLFIYLLSNPFFPIAICSKMFSIQVVTSASTQEACRLLLTWSRLMP